MSLRNGLTDILETLDVKIDSRQMSFGEVVKVLNHRGFAPLLLIGPLLIVLPTGAIPGIPTICAIYIILISAQVVWGRRYPWLPQRLKTLSIPKDKFNMAIEKARPVTMRIDNMCARRLNFLTNGVTARLGALGCILLCFCIPPLEFVPFAAVIPAVPILFFALAMAIGDGLLMAFSFALMTLAIIGLPTYFLNYSLLS